MNVNERDEISASVAAHAELGPRYESAVAEGLVERIGEEIDKRIDARLGGRTGGRTALPPRPAGASFGPAEPAAERLPPTRRGGGLSGMLLGLGSMGLAVGATAVVVSHRPAAAAGVLMVLLIWAAIAVINVAHSQRRL